MFLSVSRIESFDTERFYFDMKWNINASTRAMNGVGWVVVVWVSQRDYIGQTTGKPG